MENCLAGRTGAILSGDPENSVPSRDEGDGYSYLPWVDLICAGVPCQDVSIAGKRAGLAGERTVLVYEFARILRELRPTWFLFENVPGLLSSNGGRDFAEVQRLFMVECGYGICWRVLDSQFFGVAQRRRRLFIVGRFGKPCPPEILFECEGSAGNPEESKEARSGASGDVAYCARISGALTRRDDKGTRCDIEESAFVVAFGANDDGRDVGDNISPTLRCGGIGGGGVHTSVAYTIANVKPGRMQENQNGKGWNEDDKCYTLSATDEHAVAYSAGFNLMAGASAGSIGYQEGIAPTLRGAEGGNKAGVISASPNANGVRDFTGLPEGMDSPRYRALGNAVTKTVAEWIAKRILDAEVE